MRPFGEPQQQAGVALGAGTQMAPRFPFQEQAFQVVEHQQHALLPQVLQQEAQASVQVGSSQIQWLWGEHLEALLQERFAGGGIAQRAKQHDLEVLGQLVHGARDERRLTDAAQAQHAHHPTALPHHPLGEGGQFPFAPIKARHIQRVTPIHPWTTSSRYSSSGWHNRQRTVSWLR